MKLLTKVMKRQSGDIQAAASKNNWGRKTGGDCKTTQSLSFSVSLFMRSTDVSTAHSVTFSPSLVVLRWVKDETIVTQAQHRFFLLSWPLNGKDSKAVLHPGIIGLTQPRQFTAPWGKELFSV